MTKEILCFVLLILVILSNISDAHTQVPVKGENPMYFGGLFDVRHYKESGPFEFELGALELSIHAKLRDHVHLIAKGEFNKDGGGMGEDVHILFNFQNFIPHIFNDANINARFGRFIPAFGHEGMRSRRRVTVQPSEMTEFLGVVPDDGVEGNLSYSIFHGSLSCVNGTPDTQEDALDYVARGGISFHNLLLDFFAYRSTRHQLINELDIKTNRYGGVLEYFDGTFRFQAEMIQGDGAINEIEKSSSGDNVETPLGLPYKSMGYYILGGYKVLSWLELIGKYSYFDYDTDDEDNQERSRITGTLIGELTHRSYIKIEGALNKEEPIDVNNHNFVAQLIVEF